MSRVISRVYLLCTVLLELFVIGISYDEEESHESYKDDEYGVNWMYFPDGDGIPRAIPLEVPPAPVQRGATFGLDDIEFRLYTRENMDNYILLDYKTARPYNASSNNIAKKLSNAPIKVVTHGWESSANKNAVINIKNNYLKKQDVNVIAVDWGSIANSLWYPIVAYETKMVGSRVAKFINALSNRYNVLGNQLHLIGHSLGAHVMGNAGYETKLKVDRITGLDPARPLFEYPKRQNSVKLDTSDANFVDVIHTCVGILGVEESIGHADFFPNSGAAPQPGCSQMKHFMEACSHSRSHFYFAESILKPRAFPAFQCRSWSEYLQNRCTHNTFMGDSVSYNATGTFYLETNQAYPFGRGLDI